DSSRLLTIAGTVRLRDTRTWAELGKVEGYSYGASNTAAFSPDGARVLVANELGKAVILDATNGREVLRIQPNRKPSSGIEPIRVSSTPFSSDGVYSAVQSRAGVRVWQASPGP